MVKFIDEFQKKLFVRTTAYDSVRNRSLLLCKYLKEQDLDNGDCPFTEEKLEKRPPVDKIYDFYVEIGNRYYTCSQKKWQ